MSLLISTKPLSQQKEAVRRRQMILEGDPRIDVEKEKDRKRRRKAIDEKKRRRAVQKFKMPLTLSHWTEIARHRSRGRDTGYTAIATNLPEWIVAIFFKHIDVWDKQHANIRSHIDSVKAEIRERARL